MTEKKIEAKFQLFNILNLSTAAYGWFHTHTFSGAFWGWAFGTVGVPLLFMAIILAVVFGSRALTAIADALPAPKVRVAEDIGLRDGESQEARWNREYAEHCKAHGLKNELPESAPIHRESDSFDNTTSSSSDTSSYYYTSSSGPG